MLLLITASYERIKIDASGIVRILNNGSHFGVALDISATSAIKLPVGTSRERPEPETGMIRYNNETHQIEFYDGSGWLEIDLRYRVTYPL